MIKKYEENNINISINSCNEKNNDHDISKKAGTKEQGPPVIMSINDNYNSNSCDEPPKKRLRLTNSKENEKKQNCILFCDD